MTAYYISLKRPNSAQRLTREGPSGASHRLGWNYATEKTEWMQKLTRQFAAHLGFEYQTAGPFYSLEEVLECDLLCSELRATIIKDLL